MRKGVWADVRMQTIRTREQANETNKKQFKEQNKEMNREIKVDANSTEEIIRSLLFVLYYSLFLYSFYI